LNENEYQNNTQDQPGDFVAQVEKTAHEAIDAAEIVEQKQVKKESSEDKKTEQNKRKELLGAYEAAVKLFGKTRANRDQYWTEKDWDKREYWDVKALLGRQKKLFKKQIQYMWKNSAYMRVKMEGEGIVKAKEIKKLDDLVRLPFISNADLSRSQSEMPPYGDVCCVKSDEIIGVATSGKASGAPRYFFTSKRDMASAYRLVRPLITAGITSKDVVVVLGNK
jgi:hypothetical protein